MNEVGKEGIAVDLDNAITSFRTQINPNASTTTRLFAQDLQLQELRFLDIGCGIGRHMLILRNNGIKIAFGFDIVSKLVGIARQEFRLENLLVANALSLPFPNGSVDRVLMYNVLEHCSEPNQVLSEVHRVLSRDGLFYFDVPNASSMGDRLFRWGGKIVYGKTSHIQKFTWSKIERIVDMTGFRILQSTTQRGIYLDYPQLKEFPLLKKTLKLMFDKEILGWELKLGQK